MIFSEAFVYALQENGCGWRRKHLQHPFWQSFDKWIVFTSDKLQKLSHNLAWK